MPNTKSKKIIEITASISAVIPTGNYENYKPMYSVKEIITLNENKNNDEVISKRTDELRELLNSKLENDYERLKIERIKQQRTDLRFYPRGNKQYPSVTSVIYAIEPIDFDPLKLKQYGSRGSIVHSQISHFLKTGKFEKDISKIPGTKLDYIIVTQGSLGLKWTDCNFLGFWEKYGKDFEVISFDTTVFNDEYQYAGSLDLKAKYKGELSIIDFKTAAEYGNENLNKYWRQTAAYAKCDPDKPTQLMIIPLNPKNKSGFGEPIIEKDIDRYFGLFLQDRTAFKEIYGV